MGNSRTLIMVFVLLITGATPVWAEWWIEGLSSGAQHVTGTSRLGPYPTRAAAEAVNLQYFNGQATVTGWDSPSSISYGSSISYDDPRIQVAQQVGQALGQAIANELLGDPQATRNEALSLNNQGIQYYNNGQWKLAADAFKAALDICPQDQTIRQNLENAQQALARLQAQEEKEKQEAIARKKQETYNRLSGVLELSSPRMDSSSGPQLMLGDAAETDGGKDLRMGDNDNGHAGIRGLPGIALNDNSGKGSDRPYGIPGLPGVYVNGPGSGIAQPGEAKLQMMIGDDDASPASSANNTRNATPNDNSGNGSNTPYISPGLPGVNTKGLDSGSGTAPAEEAKLQIMIGDDSTLPEQANNAVTQPISSTGPQTTITSVPVSLQQQASASQTAAAAPSLEDASAKSRAGFDSALPPNSSTPLSLSSGSHSSTTPVPPEQTVAVPKTLFDKPTPSSAPVDFRANGPSRLYVGGTGSTQVVDLRHSDPNKPNAFDNDLVAVRANIIKSINDLAKRLGWSAEKQARLDKALNKLDFDGDPNVTSAQINHTWQDIITRGQDPELAREASQGGGLGFPGAGTQTVNNDCAVFALANAAGLPYGVVATRATEIIHQGDWREAGDRANPQAAIEQKGLIGGEVVMLAESFGQAEVVPSSDFAKTLTEGRPVMINVVPPGGNLSDGHEVVLTKTFQHGGETWFEMMDSNQGPQRRLFLSSQELNTILNENGVAYRPEPGMTPMLLRNGGDQ